MFVAKGNDSEHRQQQAFREFGVLYTTDQMKEGKARPHRNLNFQRLTTLVFVMAKNKPASLSHDWKPVDVKRGWREVVSKALNVVAG